MLSRAASHDLDDLTAFLRTADLTVAALAEPAVRLWLERDDAGARQAWLFSRRSGGFWQKLGFEPTTTDSLATALPDAHQVQLFRSTGQLDREVAWRRPLPVRANFAA